MSFIVLTGYPIYDATTVALETVRKWLELKDEQGNKNADLVNMTIIYLFTYVLHFKPFFMSKVLFWSESRQSAII